MWEYFRKAFTAMEKNLSRCLMVELMPMALRRIYKE